MATFTTIFGQSENSFEHRTKEDAQSNAILNILEEELLRAKIRELIGEPRNPSFWQRISTNPLISIFIGFLLTGVIGTFLTYYYNDKQRQLELQRVQQQKEIERDRSFSDELNKKRVEKIAEVWERMNVYQTLGDAIVDNLDEYFTSSDVTEKQRNEQIKKLKRDIDSLNDKSTDILFLITKNRFWLGEDQYSELHNYILINDKYFKCRVKSIIIEENCDDEEELSKKREQARTSIIQIRKKLLAEH